MMTPTKQLMPPPTQKKPTPTLSVRKIASYGVLATITAPITVPAAWIGYQAYRVTRWAFSHPNASLAAATAGVLLLYADQRGCTYRSALHTAPTAGIVAPVGSTTRSNSRAAPNVVYAAPMSLEERAAQLPSAQPDVRATLVLRDEQSYFYFVQPGETTVQLAQRFTGDAEYASVIAATNGVDGRPLIAGERLQLSRSICRRSTAGLYEQVPDLASVVLSAGEGVHERFGDRTSAVIALNKRLGLPYESYAGERVVWYEK